MKTSPTLRAAALLLALLLLSACGAPAQPPEPSAAPVTEAPAETEAPRSGPYLLQNGECVVDDVDRSAAAETADNARVFYEIFVGSFSDSDGDGLGDLRGIINRMDYLNDGDPASGLSLGVEGLWLTPIFRSRSYHKYNVADYYEIDPGFGTQADLEELIDLCHARNVKLILDLPINHTDTLHPWFSAFTLAHRTGDTESPYYDFYSYYNAAGENVPAGRVFQPLAGTTDLYECNFSTDMPELNFDSEAVRAAVVDVARYYLEKGVDGFRFDAAKYVYLGDNERSAEFWDWYLDELRAIRPDGYFVAEVWDGDGVIEDYYSALDCFAFAVAQPEGLIAQTAMGGPAERYASYVGSFLSTVQAKRPGALYVPFISNHDMDRAAGFLTVASKKMQMGANLCVLSPGSPFLYYGEELGLRGSRGGDSTDANRRLAMPWGDGDAVQDPEGSTYPTDNRVDRSAAEQKALDWSLYTYYKRLLMIRQANPEIARGEYRALRLNAGKLGGFVSIWNGGAACVLHNPGLSSASVALSDLGADLTRIAAVIGAEDASLTDGVLTVGGQTSVVLR